MPRCCDLLVAQSAWVSALFLIIDDRSRQAYWSRSHRAKAGSFLEVHGSCYTCALTSVNFGVGGGLEKKLYDVRRRRERPLCSES
jgi:hypothetical protein